MLHMPLFMPLQLTVEYVAVAMHLCILAYMSILVVREFIFFSMLKLDKEYQGTVGLVRAWWR
jgi:hypothetical protein